ncbi:MAG: membrane protein insertion efficiency factor YidD [Elusimicrobia bacterium CG1_02_63_36]|nr:MAG: membrane protein insertion efficiency factor YidD [Elusimicrobia bacterium CG1_02_63_36]
MMRTLLLNLLRFYRLLLRPLLGPRCRFAPSCSDYAEEALRSHPVLRALRLTASRLLRCHPLHPGGVDPVPAPLSHG